MRKTIVQLYLNHSLYLTVCDALESKMKKEKGKYLGHNIGEEEEEEEEEENDQANFMSENLKEEETQENQHHVKNAGMHYS